MGGVLFSHSSNIVVVKSNFSHNIVLESGTGGVLFSYKSNFTVKSSNFLHNKAQLGGALYCYQRSNITIETTHFDNNSASNGGALMSYGDTMTIEGSAFRNNSATVQGGSIRTHRSTITIKESEFQNNIALRGGALYCEISTVTTRASKFQITMLPVDLEEYWYSYRGTVMIEDSSFHDNTVIDIIEEREGGGALFSTDSNFVIKASEFSKIKPNLEELCVLRKTVLSL